MRLSKTPKTVALVGSILVGGATLGMFAARRSVLYLTLPMVVLAVVSGVAVVYVVIRSLFEDQRALRAGMSRPRKGFAVRIREHVLEVTAPGQQLTRIPIIAVHRALFVRDDLFERSPGLTHALTIYWGDGADTVRVPATADGFVELLTWARGNVPFEEHVVKLS